MDYISFREEQTMIDSHCQREHAAREKLLHFSTRPSHRVSFCSAHLVVFVPLICFLDHKKIISCNHTLTKSSRCFLLAICSTSVKFMLFPLCAT